jgi:hypothetical protein
MEINLEEIEMKKIREISKGVSGILRSYQERINQLETDNEKLKYWIEEIKKENDWLTGYLKAWKELPDLLKPAMLSEDDEYLREVMGDLEKKYLGGKK